MDVSGRGEGENPELGLVSGSSSSSSSGGSLKVTSSSFSSPPLDVKLKSRLFSVDHKVEQNQSINQSINQSVNCSRGSVSGKPWKLFGPQSHF